MSAHKADGAAKAVESAGASVKFLPPDSPDFNPIELMRSKMKTISRKFKIRKKELFNDAAAGALDAVSDSDIQGWFRLDKYLPPKVKAL